MKINKPLYRRKHPEGVYVSDNEENYIALGGYDQTDDSASKPSSMFDNFRWRKLGRNKWVVALFATLVLMYFASQMWDQSRAANLLDLPDEVISIKVKTRAVTNVGYGSPESEESEQQWDEEEEERDQEEQAAITEEVEEEEMNALPVRIVSNSDPIRVCVSAPNVRVASIFVRNYLKTFGGRLEFVMSQGLRDALRLFVQSGSLDREDVSTFSTGVCSPSDPRLNLVFQVNANKAPKVGTTIVVGDEFCNCPRTICGDQISKNVEYRQYYSEQLPLKYLPLGPRFEFKPVEEQEWKPIGERTYAFNFIGAPTDPSRKRMVALLQNPSIRAQFPDALGSGFLHLTPRWKKDAASSGYILPSKYGEILLQSKFTLCPAGNNPEAFRIYEAVDSGSIPVLALDDAYKNHKCQGAFARFIATDAPFVFLNSWDDLPARMNELLSNPKKLARMQVELMNWRVRFWNDIITDLECTIVKNSALVSKVGKDFCPYEDLSSIDATLLSSKNVEPVVRKTSFSPPSAVSKKTIPLVTGCGRSGTLSIQEYLKSIGVQALHEDMKQGSVSVSWLYAADSMLYPFETLMSRNQRKIIKRQLGQGNPIFGPVVLLTRHPLKVISSTRRCFCGKGDRAIGAKFDLKSWRFTEKFLPRMNPQWPVDHLERSAVYWVDWNKLIDQKFPDRVQVRLEDLDPKELIHGLGLENQVDVNSLPSQIPRAAHHTSPQKEKDRLPDVTWRDLHEANESLAREIFDLAQTYGYELDNTYEDVISL